VKKEKRVTIKIPQPLYAKLSKVIEDSSFNSVTDFIIYVLRDVISAKAAKEEAETLTKEEVAHIRERLKNLGYL